MRRLGTATIAVVLLWLAAACSSSPGQPGATASPSPSADLMALAHQAAVCARAHGMPNLGDPTLGSDGHPHFPNENNLQIPQSAREACQSIIDRISAAEGNSNGDGYQPKPADVPKLIQFAQCMRSHGFPTWPDPNSDGTFPAAGLPHKSPAMGNAMNACNQYNPDPHGGIHGSR